MWEEVYKDIPKIFGAILVSWLFVGACFGVAAIVAKIDPSLKISGMSDFDESEFDEIEPDGELPAEDIMDDDEFGQ
jgi:hypothetical protein